MRRSTLFRTFAGCAAALVLAAAGCSTALIKAPVVIEHGDVTITLSRLTSGPNQYNTAGGYWEPKPRRRFLWATFVVHNRGKAERVVRLDCIILHAGGRQFKPFIIDMDSVVTVKAGAAPPLAPGESITRKIIYAIPVSAGPEKLVYENDTIAIPALK